MDYLVFNNNRVSLEKSELFLVKEFGDLADAKRNKCPEDKTGELGLKAIKELSFIFLNYDWKSPYVEFSEQERLEASLLDSKLSEKELQDPIFKQAANKYQLLQETRILKMLKSTYKAIDNLRLFFETVDLTETDTFSGKPIYNAKDVISNIQNLGKMIEGLQQLELMVKREREQAKATRGDQEKGLFD